MHFLSNVLLSLTYMLPLVRNDYPDPLQHEMNFV